jgi:transcriptional regulator of acetoin/glycerol metabolism
MLFGHHLQHAEAITMNEPGRNGLQLGHAELVRAAAESASSAAQSALAASWRRSLVYHRLDPEGQSPPDRVEDAALREARQRLGPLAAIAGPIIDRVLNAVGRAGCCVLLTDTNGVIVDRRGMPTDDEIFSEWGLWTGAVWSEARQGTNGIGTCLAEQRPVAILREDHFRTLNTAMSCMGAPIFDDQGRLAGVLDVSSCRGELVADLVPLIATVIADAAHRIESEAFRAAFPDCRIVMTPAHGHRGASLLAVGSYDLVVGATRLARQTLGLTDHFLARPVADVLSSGRQASDLRAAERAELQRALARTDGNVSAAARELGIGRATLYRRMRRVGLSDGSELPAPPLAGAPQRPEELLLSHN